MRHTLLIGVLLCCFGFGPCSKSDASEPEKKGEPEKKKDDGEKKKPKKDDDDPEPMPLAGENWVGEANGTTPEGGTWNVQVWNCSKNPNGPWQGSMKFGVAAQGMNMTGKSTDWPAVTFETGKFTTPHPITIKAHVDGSGMVKMSMDTTTNVDVWLEGTKTFHLKEKKATGDLKAQAQGANVSWFGGGASDKGLDIPLTTGGCAGDHPLKMLVPPAKK